MPFAMFRAAGINSEALSAPAAYPSATGSHFCPVPWITAVRKRPLQPVRFRPRRRHPSLALLVSRDIAAHDGKPAIDVAMRDGRVVIACERVEIDQEHADRRTRITLRLLDDGVDVGFRRKGHLGIGLEVGRHGMPSNENIIGTYSAAAARPRDIASEEGKRNLMSGTPEKEAWSGPRVRAPLE